MANAIQELKHRGIPPDEIVYGFGTINFVWARLDVLTTACLFTLNEANPHEFIVLVGQLDPLAKLQRIKKILGIRGDKLRANAVANYLMQLVRLKDERNAITQGLYLGMTEEQMTQNNEICIALYTQVEAGVDKQLGTRLVRIPVTDIAAHVEVIMNCTNTLLALFDGERLNKLLGLPAFSPQSSS